MQGNEQADLAAKETCQTTFNLSRELSISSAWNWVRTMLETARKDYWLNDIN